MFFATALKWYKRPAVQAALLKHAADREVSVRYGPDSFGKRPDMLAYPADVLEFAKKKVTSFHCSEERWRDPMSLLTDMTRKQQDDLRIGWDLVLDIDCPDWSFSRLTTLLFIKALEDHDIKSVTCKFSGNKGFHIGVPFESFPETHDGQLMKDLFPEVPRAIAQYLLHYIEERYVKVKENDIIFIDKVKVPYEKAKALGGDDVIKSICPECKKPRKSISKVATFVCPICEHQEKSEADYVKCPHDGTVMERFSTTSTCGCGSALPAVRKFNIGSMIELDTILLASRHLYRMPFSLHEKSGLVSVPIEPKQVLKFKKTAAKPGVEPTGDWLVQTGEPGEAVDLLAKAMAHQVSTEVPKIRKEFTAPEEAVPEELFPPCIKLILAGLKDGKKRALFILTNFLSAVGWNNDMIEERIWEWNKANPESLRTVIIKSHLKLKSKKREIILPPNCKSDYYKALGVCKPDDMCKTIKNPAQYALRRFRAAQGTAGKGGGRAKLTEEQKAARRLYRERMKRKEQEKKGGKNGAAGDKE